MALRKKDALFLGRFQPPHLGHERAMKWILARHGKLLVVIGSSNKRREKENPLSANERKMLLGKIRRAHVGWERRVRFALQKDYEVHEKWLAQMLRRFPPEKYEFYTNNALVQHLFASKGYAVHGNPEFRRMENEGRRIRALAKAGKGISKRLPAAIREKAGKIAKNIAGKK